MSNKFHKYISLLAVVVLTSCKIFSTSQQIHEYAADLVCGMKVDVTEAYEWKYKGEKYYFDTYNCKEAFKMNPEKFLTKNCADKK